MNRSLRKDLMREIRGSWTRFLSIFVMVALGVLFLVGLRSAAPDMRATADSFFDENGCYDLEVLSTLGLTKEDIAAFSQVRGVEAAEGGWSLDAMLTLDEVEKTVKLLDLSDGGFHTPTVVEGTLPTEPDQCALDEKLLTALDVSVGDTVSLTVEEDDALAAERFTVTAVVRSPLYISLDRGTSTLGDGSVSGFVLLPKESFALDYYTVAYIAAEGAEELDAYGTEYRDLISELEQRLEEAADQRAELRYETLVSDAQTEIDDAQAELDDARQEADQEIADAEQELADARTELDDGWQELADARTELDDGWAELEQGKQDYADGEAEGRQELADARAELDEGWAELADARSTLNSSQRTLDTQRTEAEAQLAEAQAELESSQALLEEKEAELEEARTQVEALRQQTEGYAQALEAQQAQVEAAEAAGIPVDPSTLPYHQETLGALEAALADAEAQLAAGEQELAAGQEQLAMGWEEYEQQAESAEEALDAAQAEINSGWGDYYAARTELEQGETDYAQALEDFEAELTEAAQELRDAEQELTDGEADYAEGQEELTDGEADYAEGREELAQARTDADTELNDAQAEIDDAKAQLADISPADVYVLDRDSNYGFVSYDQNATRMENLARMFPVIFFVVAALVCLTTMTRMVEEERTQNGTIKAMGYGTGAIAGKFLLYGVLAALGGAVVGAVVGTTLIPWVIFTSYSIMYDLPALQLSVHWGLILAATAAGLLCTVGATLWAVGATARLSPAELMRPKAPKAGKRILLERVTPLWKRMSFSMKVSARNLFRYKKRFWMTVIGVAGCTALLIAGLGLRSSIFSIIDVQYGEIYRYSVQVAVDPEVDGAMEAVAELLSDWQGVDSTATCYTRSVTFSAGGASVDGHLVVTDDPESLYGQITFRDMQSGAAVEIPADGVVLDEKLAELLEVRVGDEITVDCGELVTVKVGGIVEHYVYHYAYLDAALYTSLLGEEYAPNEFLVTETADADSSALCEALLALDGVQSATNMVESARSFRETLEVVDAAVSIIVLSAAALALVVLYNLTNINITERIRELATIKVLGFYDMEVAMYIYRENIVLTVLGIALGQLLGKFLCTYLVRTIEMDIVMFGRHALFQNYAASVGLSLLFAVLVNTMMFFRMRKIDMVQSLKSVE